MDALFLAGGTLYLALLCTKVLLALVYAANDPAAEDESLKPGSLTLAQAILGGDPGLSAVLEANLLALPGQRFLWLCDEDDAEGLGTARQLAALHPEIDVRIIVCTPCPDGWNPKVFKLVEAARHLETPYIAVVDDDTRLPAETAATLVQHLSHCTISTGVPCYSNGDGIAASLLEQFVNNNSATTYLPLLPFMDPPSINGMCYAMKAADAARFADISDHLTDDLALAQEIRRSGGKIYQSSHPQIVSTSVEDLPHYTKLMHRWYLFAILLLESQPREQKIAIIFLHGWHPLLLWALVTIAVLAPSAATVIGLLVLLACRAGLIRLIQRRLFGHTLHHPFVSLLSELLQPVHLCHAFLNRKIEWRGRRYRVYASNRFESILPDRSNPSNPPDRW